MVHAEQWVNNMSKTKEEDESTVPDSGGGGRPDRLGLGAKAKRNSNIGPLNDPVERKLHSKLNAAKRKFSSADEVSVPSERDGSDDDNDELESRTKAFVRKQAISLATSAGAKKKQK